MWDSCFFCCSVVFNAEFVLFLQFTHLRHLCNLPMRYVKRRDKKTREACCCKCKILGPRQDHRWVPVDNLYVVKHSGLVDSNYFINEKEAKERRKERIIESNKFEKKHKKYKKEVDDQTRYFTVHEIAAPVEGKTFTTMLYGNRRIFITKGEDSDKLRKCMEEALFNLIETREKAGIGELEEAFFEANQRWSKSFTTHKPGDCFQRRINLT